MTDRNKFEQMLEFLVNEDQAKAKEMFHQIVVEKSREIYENLLSEEFDEDVEEGQAEEDDGMEEGQEAEDDDGMEEGMDEETDEGFDMSMEAEDDGMPELGSEEDGMPSMDGSDDFENDMKRSDPQEIVGDLGSAVDDLDSLVAELEDAIAAFDGSAGRDTGGEGDEEPKEQYAFEDETLVREYVEKVGEAYKGGKAAGTSEAGGANTKAIFNKAKYNDMGGTTANIAKGGEGGGNKTSLPGHANAKTENGGNVNVPGGKAGVKHLKGVSAGHGAEKKGSGDTATNKKSIIGSR